MVIVISLEYGALSVEYGDGNSPTPFQATIRCDFLITVHSMPHILDGESSKIRYFRKFIYCSTTFHFQWSLSRLPMERESTQCSLRLNSSSNHMEQRVCKQTFYLFTEWSIRMYIQNWKWMRWRRGPHILRQKFWANIYGAIQWAVWRLDRFNERLWCGDGRRESVYRLLSSWNGQRGSRFSVKSTYSQSTPHILSEKNRPWSHLQALYRSSTGTPTISTEWVTFIVFDAFSKCAVPHLCWSHSPSQTALSSNKFLSIPMWTERRGIEWRWSTQKRIEFHGENVWNFLFPIRWCTVHWMGSLSIFSRVCSLDLDTKKLLFCAQNTVDIGCESANGKSVRFPIAYSVSQQIQNIWILREFPIDFAERLCEHTTNSMYWSIGTPSRSQWAHKISAFPLSSFSILHWMNFPKDSIPIPDGQRRHHTVHQNNGWIQVYSQCIPSKAMSTLFVCRWRGYSQWIQWEHWVQNKWILREFSVDFRRERVHIDPSGQRSGALLDGQCGIKRECGDLRMCRIDHTLFDQFPVDQSMTMQFDDQNGGCIMNVTQLQLCDNMIQRILGGETMNGIDECEA